MVSPCSGDKADFWSCFAGLPTLDLPFVDGFRLRTYWGAFEPQPGVRNWTNFDSVIAKAKAKGKFLGIHFAAGRSTLPWVYDTSPTCTRFPVDPVGDPGQPYMPVPWQPGYLSKFKAFVSEWGARYDAEPTLRYVVITGCMQNCELYFSQTAVDDAKWQTQAVADGYADKSIAFSFAARQIIDAFLAAFPTTCVLWTTATGPWFDKNLGATVRAEIEQYGLTTYPNHFGIMKASAHAVLPENRKPKAPKVSYPFGSQEVVGSTNTAKNFYQPDNPNPPPPDQPVDDMLQQANVESRQYVEIYQDDLTVTSPTVLTSGRALLLANLTAQLPPLPKAPTLFGPT